MKKKKEKKKNCVVSTNLKQTSTKILDQKINICVWGYMLKKIRVGMYDFFFFCFFYHYFFNIQGACGTPKQNLVKFKYTQVIN